MIYGQLNLTDLNYTLNNQWLVYNYATIQMVIPYEN